jgi:hypothetical protein
MDEIKDFENFYSLKLQPLIKNLKNEAHEAGNWGIAALVAPCISLLVFAGYQLDYLNEYSGTALFLCIVSIVTTLYFFVITKDRYTKDFKETVITEIIKYLHPGMIYKPEEVIAKQDYKHSSLFRTRFEYYDGDDYMEAVYKGVQFRCSELHVRTESIQIKPAPQNRGSSIFKGLFFVGKINESFSGGTYLWPKGKAQIGESIADEHFRLMPLPHVYKVKLQDAFPGFDGHFSVYSTNPAEAGIILTTAMTERLLKFKQQIDREIAVSFVAGRCYVAISINEELLEPSGFDTDDKEEVKRYFFTILLVLSIINQLHLNELQ